MSSSHNRFGDSTIVNTNTSANAFLGNNNRFLQQAQTDVDSVLALATTNKTTITALTSTVGTNTSNIATNTSNISSLVSDVDGFPDSLKNLTLEEITQLENIGTNTISNTQWGYLGNQNQALTTTSTPTFGATTINGTLAVNAPSMTITNTTGQDACTLTVQGQGNVFLDLRADPDNGPTETENPYIRFFQDGTVNLAQIRLMDDSNNSLRFIHAMDTNPQMLFSTSTSAGNYSSLTNQMIINNHGVGVKVAPTSTYPFNVSGNSLITGTLTTTGNVNIGTNKITMDSSNGNITTTGNLDVGLSPGDYGRLRMSAANTWGSIYTSSSLSDTLNLGYNGYYNEAGTWTNPASWYSSRIALGYGFLNFFTSPTTESEPLSRMYVNLDGQVLINTTTPTSTEKFHVNGNSVFQGTTAQSGNLAVNTNKFTVDATSGDVLVAGDLTVSGTVNATIVGTDLHSTTNGAETISITSNGGLADTILVRNMVGNAENGVDIICNFGGISLSPNSTKHVNCNGNLKVNGQLIKQEIWFNLTDNGNYDSDANKDSASILRNGSSTLYKSWTGWTQDGTLYTRFRNETGSSQTVRVIFEGHMSAGTTRILPLFSIKTFEADNTTLHATNQFTYPPEMVNGSYYYYYVKMSRICVVPDDYYIVVDYEDGGSHNNVSCSNYFTMSIEGL